VKLTRALVQDHDEAIKEVKLLGEHGEEASQKITELEALCKKRREEKTKLEGMIESLDELIMEFTNKYGYNHSDEVAGDEDEDDDGEGDAATPPATAPPPVLAPPAAAPKEIIVEKDPMEMVSEQQAPKARDVILADAEPKLPQTHLFNILKRDYEESPSRMMDDFDDLDEPTETDYNVHEWFPMDGSNDWD
jgi:hypothetical protein